MAVAFRAAGTFSTTTTVNYPAGVATGDLLVLHVSWSGGLTTPSGWTKLFGPLSPPGPTWSCYLFWKIAGGSEPSTVTLSGAAIAAFMCAYTGAHATTPIDTYATANLPGSGTAITTPTATTTVANTMLLRMYSVYAASASITPAAGTERYDATTGASNYCMLEMAEQAQAGIGASGTQSATLASDSFGGLGATVAVAPAAAAAAAFVPRIIVT